MATILDRNNKFYTEDGLKALQTRLKSWCYIYNNNDVPCNTLMFGFGKVDIQTKEELENRIKELSEIIGHQVTEEISESSNDFGQIIKQKQYLY